MIYLVILKNVYLYKLLQLSGIGDSAELSEVGIRPEVHLPGVGKNLQDHLEIAVQQECKLPITLYKGYFLTYPLYLYSVFPNVSHVLK